MVDKSELYYFHACMEIESALESLINLSDLILDDIATEAATGESEEGKKNEVTKKLALTWVDKFTEWGKKKFDKPVEVSTALDENKITRKVDEIIRNFDYSYWNTYRYDKNIKEVEDIIKDLNEELATVTSKRSKGSVKKTGLFKALRAKLAAAIKKNSAQMEKEGYAEAIREQIKVANQLMTYLSKTEAALRGPSSREAVPNEEKAKSETQFLKHANQTREEKKAAFIKKQNADNEESSKMKPEVSFNNNLKKERKL